MAEGLPEGLVTHRPSITSEIERVDKVAIEDIIQLWKVHATNKGLLADGVGRRLENFFWRMWSSAGIRDHIRGSQVAVLFSKISEGGFLRTTPTQSPRTSRSMGSYIQTSYSDNALDVSPPNIRATTSRTQRASSGIAEENRRNIDAVDEPTSRAPNAMRTPRPWTNEVSLPPSILKKPRAESSTQLSNANTILSPAADPRRRHPSSGSEEAVVTFGSPFSDATVTETRDRASGQEQSSSSSRNEKKPSMSSSKSKMLPAEARTSGDTNSRRSRDNPKPARTKPAVHAKTGANRRRPVAASRKSSQSSSSNASNVTSPSLSGKKVASSNEPLDVNVDADACSRRPVRLARSSQPRGPHPSKHGALDTASESSSSDEEEEEEECAGTSQNHLDDTLVDRDFRSKFASRIRPEPQFPGSLTALQRTPAPALADSAPYEAASTTRFEQAKQRNGKSKRTVGFTDEIISLKPPGASAEENDEDIPSVIPRTKSQLTFLLEQDRRKSGGDNTPPKAGRR
ncbi:hypothetical protein MMC07_004231 [Pseudocyphellaria aurata]|nr:hypothetical protein [Pseudocyphellaria aurata]